MINKHTLATKEIDFKTGEVILIDKPLLWTSFNIVSKIRYIVKGITGDKRNKVGHAGTLDPLATGLVIICTGKKTKEIDSYQAQEKEYTAEITMGATTPSFDLETEINETYPTDHISTELIKNTLNQFIGKQEQMPPVFSAKKINGKRAYDLARAGKTDIEIKTHIIEIFEIELLEYSLPILRVRIKCSKGTYIRSFANDLGKALNSGAHLSKLVRTKIGNFNIEDALAIEDFEKYIRTNQ